MLEDQFCCRRQREFGCSLARQSRQDGLEMTEGGLESVPLQRCKPSIPLDLPVITDALLEFVQNTQRGLRIAEIEMSLGLGQSYFTGDSGRRCA